MVRACPELRFVLDHIGKPAIKDGLITAPERPGHGLKFKDEVMKFGI